jgi:hypothetical protein
MARLLEGLGCGEGEEQLSEGWQNERRGTQKPRSSSDTTTL